MSVIDAGWVVDLRETRSGCHFAVGKAAGKEKPTNVESKDFGLEGNRRVVQIPAFHYICSPKVPTGSIQAQSGIVLCLTA
jgi:hypothetical protein